MTTIQVYDRLKDGSLVLLEGYCANAKCTCHTTSKKVTTPFPDPYLPYCCTDCSRLGTRVYTAAKELRKI